MEFRTEVLLGGKTATGLPVPDDVVEALGAGKKPAVTVTLGGHTYRTTVASRGGRFLVPLSAENREKAGVAAGDEVTVGIALDTAPRELEIPPDLAAALAADDTARARFESLSYSAKQRFVLPIGQAKTEETRQRRVAKVITDLRAGK
ncbi:YdeI/OmpD-associated family protein [Amycolatopsis sp. FBCC-B4732]|uniref:YdeI/OmpD-associated family protein n=1 Tax=Amycolatopsis sp. FBCC-B4732 TaxID=3079339 RepID=UPI001FF357AF|nr:YdeI/OmpD-associated family protein [Amycolatopsis sp. FBCC-B4732]UOX85111.1 YdeI/OmpD-associated family protein [Amycolatopsis sp. FBCC-B4732]